MASATYKDKLLDPRWQKKRLEILQRDEFTCQNCGNKEKTLHIHHFRYNKNGDPWDVDDSVLITLCCDCHEVKEFIKTLPPFEQELFDFAFWEAYFRSKEQSEIMEMIYGKENRVMALNKIILRYKKNG